MAGHRSGGAMGLALGVGLTNACDLACAHCYRETERIDQLSLEQVTSACECLPVRSVNLGTGENGLHPDYAEIVRAIVARGVKLSLTSNGFTIERSSDETLRAFREVEVSIDFPTEAEQDAFRGRGNWRRVMAAIERAQGLGVTVTVLTVMMKTNFRRLPEIAKVAFAAGANYRVNVYQPVKTNAFTLTYEEFWDGFRRLLAAARLVLTTEPILNAMLGGRSRTVLGAAARPCASRRRATSSRACTGTSPICASRTCLRRVPTACSPRPSSRASAWCRRSVEAAHSSRRATEAARAGASSPAASSSPIPTARSCEARRSTSSGLPPPSASS